jgi:cyclopropane-fatty-acyl-phospholipid synthase
LAGRVAIEEADYRDLHGSFDKITLIGTFEHVGRTTLTEDFRKIYSLLREGGTFIYLRIVRPETESVGPAALFLQNRLFPKRELVRLVDVIREAERAGFEVLEIEDIRVR